MALTQQQRKALRRRTTASSRARLRAKYEGQSKPKKRRPSQPSALLDPSRPLSGKILRRAADALTNIEFGGERRALDRSMEQATRQGTELAARSQDYYRQLAGDVASSVARQQALGSELQQRLGASAQQSQQALSAIDQEAAQRAAQDAAVRGQGNAAAGQDRIAQEVAAARSLAAKGAQSTQEQAAMASFNYGNLQNLTGQATTAAGGEAQRDILNALSAQQGDIRGRQNDLAAQVAAKRVGNILQLRQQGFENTLAARGLDVDLAEIQADMTQSRERLRSQERQNRARVRAQRRGQDITMRGQNMTARQRAADRQARIRIAEARKKGTKLESSDARKLKIGIGNAFADLKSKNPKNPARWLRNQGAPGIVIQAAVERQQKGGLTTATYRELKRLGVKVPKSWRRKLTDVVSDIDFGI